MVDVLIATGFTVDHTAHIAYKVYKCNREERTKQTLREMSGPMVHVIIYSLLFSSFLLSISSPP